MTLTELKYIISVARERHFGRAAEACFVSQPTLSVAIKKLEAELSISLFERGSGEVTVTPVGALVVQQAQKVLDEAGVIKELAKIGKDPLSGALRLGIIHTVAPYLLPYLMPLQLERMPKMPLLLQENFTAQLLERLKAGEVDCVVLAEPFQDVGLDVYPLYDEVFDVAVPKSHPFAQRDFVDIEDLKNETMLLLGMGHCFRDHVIEACPDSPRFLQSQNGIQTAFEGSSLETLRHMVAMGVGITLLPRSSVQGTIVDSSLLKYIPLKSPQPKRRIVLACRKSYTRPEAIRALVQQIHDCGVPGVDFIK